MSEPTPPAAGRKTNIFTRKIGPLPMWAWLAITGGAVIGWEIYKSKTSSASQTSSTSTTSASDVPQFVNQVYTSAGPPSAPQPPAATTTTPGSTVTTPTTTKTPKPVVTAPATESVREVATGDQSLAQIAKANGTTVATIIAWTKASHIDAANLKKFLAAAGKPSTKLPKGTIYYLMLPKSSETPG